MTAKWIAALTLVGLTGCTEPVEQPEQQAVGPGAPVSEATQEVDDGPPAELPAEFARTAWRAVATDGARYTTYLDEDGRYRDFRNGDPWQQGSWETNSEERLCFLPDDEGAVLRCWHPDRMQGADRLIATSDNGMRIRLERADYSPPADEETG